MALVRLTLDTRTTSKKKDNTYPIVLKVFHHKPRFVRIGYYTSIVGWDERYSKLKKSASANRFQDCIAIEKEIDEKLYDAKCILKELGNSIDLINVDRLVDHIKDRWDRKSDSEIRKIIENDITLDSWGEVLMTRKRSANKPGTARWYQSGIEAVTNFNGGKKSCYTILT